MEHITRSVQFNSHTTSPRPDNTKLCTYFHLLTQQIFMLQKVNAFAFGSKQFVNCGGGTVRATNNLNLQPNVVARQVARKCSPFCLALYAIIKKSSQVRLLLDDPKSSKIPEENSKVSEDKAYSRVGLFWNGLKFLGDFGR